MSGGEFLSLVLSSAVCTDNQNAALLLFPPLLGSIEDESTAAANPKAIVFTVGGRIIGFPEKSLDFDDGCRNQYGEGRHNHGIYEHDTHWDAKG